MCVVNLSLVPFTRFISLQSCKKRFIGLSSLMVSPYCPIPQKVWDLHSACNSWSVLTTPSVLPPSSSPTPSRPQLLFVSALCGGQSLASCLYSLEKKGFYIEAGKKLVSNSKVNDDFLFGLSWFSFKMLTFLPHLWVKR